MKKEIKFVRIVHKELKKQLNEYGAFVSDQKSYTVNGGKPCIRSNINTNGVMFTCEVTLAEWGFVTIVIALKDPFLVEYGAFGHTSSCKLDDAGNFEVSSIPSICKHLDAYSKGLSLINQKHESPKRVPKI